MNFIDMPDNIRKDKEYSYNEEAISNAIRNILSTPKGTFPGHPEFGCGMERYLFSLIDPLIEQMIKTEIESALDRWEPRIRINEIIVNEDPDYNRVHIRLKYTILKDPNNMEREFIYTQNK